MTGLGGVKDATTFCRLSPTLGRSFCKHCAVIVYSLLYRPLNPRATAVMKTRLSSSPVGRQVCLCGTPWPTCSLPSQKACLTGRGRHAALIPD
jgi:hypothetical protein